MEANLRHTLLNHEYFTVRGVYQDFLEAIVSLSGSTIGYFHLYDDDSKSLRLNIWSKSVLEYCSASTDSHYPLEKAGIWADAIRERKPIFHNDYPNLKHKSDLPEGHFPLQNHAAFPIFEGHKIVGVLGVGNHPEGYSEKVITSLEAKITELYTIACEKIDGIKQREKLLEEEFSKYSPHQILLEMLKAITHNLEMRDPYTAYHQKHVAYICSEIATKLDLPEKQRMGLYIGALIHDIGKSNIPSIILTKPSKLIPEELALLRTHSSNGVEMFRECHFPWPIQDMIGQHHERLDGSGYPKGLTEHQICLEAKIIAVADTFDAMANDRPYRKARGAEAAIKVLKAGRGKEYDAYVVDAFMACYEQDPTFAGIYQ